MPLLMCPNDNAAMQTLERNGVQFDMCPTCRGVWLDRGELEKLMAAATEDGRASASPPQQAAPQPWAFRMLSFPLAPFIVFGSGRAWTTSFNRRMPGACSARKPRWMPPSSARARCTAWWS